jgi:hypothetical protein
MEGAGRPDGSHEQRIHLANVLLLDRTLSRRLAVWTSQRCGRSGTCTRKFQGFQVRHGLSLWSLPGAPAMSCSNAVAMSFSANLQALHLLSVQNPTSCYIPCAVDLQCYICRDLMLGPHPQVSSSAYDAAYSSGPGTRTTCSTLATGCLRRSRCGAAVEHYLLAVPSQVQATVHRQGSFRLKSTLNA